MTTQPAFDLRPSAISAALSAFLAKNRFCYLMPNGETNPEKAIALFDTHTGLRYSPQNSGLETFLAQHPFVYVRQAGSQTHLATLHSATGLLWNNETSDNAYVLNDGQKIAAAGRWAGLQGWQVPDVEQLKAFATAANNPHRKGKAYRLARRNGNENRYWLTTSGRYNYDDDGHWKTYIDSRAHLFAFNPYWVNRSESERFLDLMRLNWELTAPNGQTFAFLADNKQWQGIQPEQLLINLKNQGLYLHAINDKNDVFISTTPTACSQIDYTPCRLPKLHNSQLTDPQKDLFDLRAIHTNAVSALRTFLAKNRFCYLMPNGETNPENAIDLFDAHTGLRYRPQIQDFENFLAQHPFVYVRQAGSETHLATLHSATGILWNEEPCTTEGNWAGLEGWQELTKEETGAMATTILTMTVAGVATPEELLEVMQDAEAREAIQNALLEELEAASREELGKFMAELSARRKNLHWTKLATVERLVDMAVRQWELVAPDGQTFVFVANNKQWQGIQPEQLLINLKNQRLYLLAVNDKNAVFSPANIAPTAFSQIDYTPCRLPKLHNSQLTDPQKGLWELFGNSADDLRAAGVVARDPMQDVQPRAVTIDFGTSSTTVAMETASGGRELLRVGTHDFYQDIKPEHFENPTVLECIDFSAFEKTWTQQAYRPALNWDWMRAAHEAQTNLRDNEGDTQILARMLPRLKQWALRSGEQNRVRITDSKQREITLAPHSERNPVRGQALQVNAQYPFDPIELYAWFLGMVINWRARGIFLNYHLSFPVKYPRDVKDRILASFRRGLQRSLPHTLITHYPEVLNTFEVNELANEPAAYAAAALPHFKVQPTDEGVPYAVFDFGGGTCDFDYGLLRWATEEEEDQGHQQVFEHLASSGDNFLGGENLLENLVYQTFCKNLKTLGEKHIQFTKPLDAAPYAGTEAFLSNSQAAQTNSLMLAAKLRPFLESKEGKQVEPHIKLNLLDVNNSSQNCTLITDAEALETWLETRIQNGLVAFLAELARVRSAFPAGTPIHLLLAGNGCHSRHIKAFTQGAEWHTLLTHAFGNNVPEIIVHPPLPMDNANPHAPTAKTGVALGLLGLVPGRGALLVDHLQQRHDGQAPFGWFVGRMRRGQFEPKLSPNAAYGQWHEVGPLQHGIFTLFTTTSPRAHLGIPDGDPELTMLRHTFHGAPIGAKLFARATAHNSIELAAAVNSEQIEAYEVVKQVLE